MPQEVIFAWLKENGKYFTELQDIQLQNRRDNNSSLTSS